MQKKIVPNVKSVVFSAYADFEYAKKAIDIKIDCFLVKPVAVDKFHSAINTIAADIIGEKNNVAIYGNDEDVTFHSKDSNVNYHIDCILSHIACAEFEKIKTDIISLFRILHESNSFSLIYVKHIITEILKKLYVACDNKSNIDIMSALKELMFCDTAVSMEMVMMDAIEVICDNKSAADINQCTLNSAIKFIHDNYKDDISLSDLSRIMYLSPNYLSYIFKQKTGKNFSKYLMEFRIEKAKELLANTNMKVVDVCSSVGYSNLSYFCTVFKNICGMRPSEYREKW